MNTQSAVHPFSGPFAWWAILCVVSALNLVAWGVAALSIWRRRGETDPALYALRRTQLLLSAVFVLVCAFRSVFPRADVQRICLHDSWLSSVMLGRSLATIAGVNLNTIRRLWRARESTRALADEPDLRL